MIMTTAVMTRKSNDQAPGTWILLAAGVACVVTMSKHGLCIFQIKLFIDFGKLPLIVQTIPMLSHSSLYSSMMHVIDFSFFLFTFLFPSFPLFFTCSECLPQGCNNDLIDNVDVDTFYFINSW